MIVEIGLAIFEEWILFTNFIGKYEKLNGYVDLKKI